MPTMDLELGPTGGGSDVGTVLRSMNVMQAAKENKEELDKCVIPQYLLEHTQPIQIITIPQPLHGLVLSSFLSTRYSQAITIKDNLYTSCNTRMGSTRPR